MRHVILEECTSTQSYLEEILESVHNLELQEPILINTLRQTSGRGRRGNTWQTCENSLALSLYFRTKLPPTLCSIFIAVCVQEFIQSQFHTSVHLKWPNDVYIQNLKIGGIIGKVIDSGLTEGNEHGFIVGIGLNLGQPTLEQQNELKLLGAGYLLDQSFNAKELSNYCYLLAEKIISEGKGSIDEIDLIHRWHKSCVHLDKVVTISEGQKINYHGIFKGLGNKGQGLLEIDQNGSKKIVEIWSGTLRW